MTLPVTRSEVQIHWSVRIPLRDGATLSAILYLPERHLPAPAIVTLTPYMAQRYHDEGVYFASRGFPFLSVDVRGRGGSDGEFRPFVHEGDDGCDVIEWAADQPFCSGAVGMWGGSYGGYNQWRVAARKPDALKTISPFASPRPGIDFPMCNNIASPYVLQWLTLVAGRAAQEKLFADHAWWASAFLRWHRSGTAFRQLDQFLGQPSPVFQEWVAHPLEADYWDAQNPTSVQYAAMTMPILSITGLYDGDQPGVLAHYRAHQAAGRANHFLVIGPWDHAGTRLPAREFGGLRLGAASQIDLRELHHQWYRWTLLQGERPELLKKRVTYYVIGAEEWRYADTLDGVTSGHQPLYLSSSGAALSVFQSGMLATDGSHTGFDSYIYDPRDLRPLEREANAAVQLCARPTFPTDDFSDQSGILANDGRQLVYHSAPFERDLTIAGFFRLRAWIALDQPDTDFRVSVYEIDGDGKSLLLSTTAMRARHRISNREEKLIETHEPLCYEFNGFTFTSRLVRAGCRLRLVLGPVHSLYAQKNCNSGKSPEDESLQDARPVAVTVFHDASRPSVLYVPMGAVSDP